MGERGEKMKSEGFYKGLEFFSEYHPSNNRVKGWTVFFCYLFVDGKEKKLSSETLLGLKRLIGKVVKK